MWRTTLAVLVMVHGLLTILIWAIPPNPDAPMDTGKSWLLGQARPVALILAVVAGALISLSGAALLADQGWWAPVGVTGAALSLLLFGLFFTPWWLVAIAISSGIVVGAVRGLSS